MDRLCAGVSCTDLQLVESVNVLPIDFPGASLWAFVFIAVFVMGAAFEYLTREPRRPQRAPRAEAVAAEGDAP